MLCLHPLPTYTKNILTLCILKHMDNFINRSGHVLPYLPLTLFFSIFNQILLLLFSVNGKTLHWCFGSFSVV